MQPYCELFEVNNLAVNIEFLYLSAIFRIYSKFNWQMEGGIARLNKMPMNLPALFVFLSSDLFQIKSG